MDGKTYQSRPASLFASAARGLVQSEACCCYEFMGDNPNCVRHRELWEKYQAAAKAAEEKQAGVGDE